MPQGSYCASGKRQTAEHTHFPQNSSRKKRASKITSKTNEDKEARLAFVKESQSVHTAAWIQFGGTSRCHLMSLEAGAVLWQGWKQYSAGKSSRAQGKKVSERKKFYTGFLSSRHQVQILFTSVCSSSHYSPQGLRSPLKTYQGI